MAAKKAAKKAATPMKKAAAPRPSRPMPEYNGEEMRKRSSRTMTQKELQAALIKKYGVPEFEPMTVKQAVSQFQDVVSESNLWNYPGIKQATRAVAEQGHQASAEAYMKAESARRMKDKKAAQTRMAQVNANIERAMQKDREQRMKKAREKAAKKNAK